MFDYRRSGHDGDSDDDVTKPMTKSTTTTMVMMLMMMHDDDYTEPCQVIRQPRFRSQSVEVEDDPADEPNNVPLCEIHLATKGWNGAHFIASHFLMTL